MSVGCDYIIWISSRGARRKRKHWNVLQFRFLSLITLLCIALTSQSCLRSRHSRHSREFLITHGKRKWVVKLFAKQSTRLDVLIFTMIRTMLRKTTESSHNKYLPIIKKHFRENEKRNRRKTIAAQSQMFVQSDVEMRYLKSDSETVYPFVNCDTLKAHEAHYLAESWLLSDAPEKRMSARRSVKSGKAFKIQIWSHELFPVFPRLKCNRA